MTSKFGIYFSLGVQRYHCTVGVAEQKRMYDVECGIVVFRINWDWHISLTEFDVPDWLPGVEEAVKYVYKASYSVVKSLSSSGILQYLNMAYSM